MIAIVIKNNLMSESWHCLMLKKEECTWTKLVATKVFDGPTLMWVILAAFETSRNVGAQAEVKTIENAKISGYGNNTFKMLNAMKL
eukprot:4367464-Ditylum_brightwellii.AAC.1